MRFHCWKCNHDIYTVNKSEWMGMRTARCWSLLSVPVDSWSNMSSSHMLMFAVLNCFFCVKGLQASEGHQTFAFTSWTFNRNADVTCCHINITSICRPQSCSIDSRNELVWSSEGGWTEVWSVLTGLWNPVRKTERETRLCINRRRSRGQWAEPPPSHTRPIKQLQAAVALMEMAGPCRQHQPPLLSTALEPASLTLSLPLSWTPATLLLVSLLLACIARWVIPFHFWW